MRKRESVEGGRGINKRGDERTEEGRGMRGDDRRKIGSDRSVGRE